LIPARKLIPLIVACGLFMENLDSTVLSTSLPAIAASLHEDPISLKLALTSYLLSLAVFIPISGWVADKYGARTVFMAAIGVFTAGSMLCGQSNSLAEFVLFRIVQGLGGAMMVPVGHLVILRSVPKQELISALAWLTIPALLGPVIGPPLGGFITTYFDWRWIFYVNVPIGALGLVLTWKFITNVMEADTPPLDKTGFALSGIGLSAFVFGLAVLGENTGSLGLGFLLTAAGLTICAIYVWRARRTENPVIDLRLLRIPTFRAGVLGASLFRIGIGAVPFLLPLMLQLSFGLSPFQSGTITFAASAGSMLMKATAAPIIRGFGFRNVLIVNSLISSAFLAATGFFTAATAHAVIIATLLMGGFFRSLEFTAVNALAYADVQQHDMSRATSFASVAQQVSLSLGVAFGALILQGARGFRGETAITQSDFALAFWIVSAISALSVISFLRLPAGAGEEMAGTPPGSAAVTAPASGANPRAEATVP
jgi:EmrB/QacA subfamily drug resistance transporter